MHKGTCTYAEHTEINISNPDPKSDPKLICKKEPYIQAK